jgi:hypothetical protein
MHAAVQAAVRPSLKGKSCFHVKRLDATLRDDIAAALKLGTMGYPDRGWV